TIIASTSFRLHRTSKSVSTSQFISFATFSALLGSKIAFTLPPSRLLIIFASLAPKYPVPTIAYPIVFVIFYFFLLLYIIYFYLIYTSVSPPVIFFCINIKNIIVGITTKNEAAIIAPHANVSDPLREYRATETGIFSWLLIRMRENKNSFQVLIKVNNAVATIPGAAIGSAI